MAYAKRITDLVFGLQTGSGFSEVKRFFFLRAVLRAIFFASPRKHYNAIALFEKDFY